MSAADVYAEIVAKHAAESGKPHLSSWIAAQMSAWWASHVIAYDRYPSERTGLDRLEARGVQR